MSLTDHVPIRPSGQNRRSGGTSLCAPLGRVFPAHQRGARSVADKASRRHRITKFRSGTSLHPWLCKGFPRVHFFWGRRTAPRGCVSLCAAPQNVRPRTFTRVFRQWVGEHAAPLLHGPAFSFVISSFRHGHDFRALSRERKKAHARSIRYARGRCREVARHQNPGRSG